MTGAADGSKSSGNASAFLSLFAQTLSQQAGNTSGSTVASLLGLFDGAKGTAAAAGHDGSAVATTDQPQVGTTTLDASSLSLIQSLVVPAVAAGQAVVGHVGTVSNKSTSDGLVTGGGGDRQILPSELAVLADKEGGKQFANTTQDAGQGNSQGQQLTKEQIAAFGQMQAKGHISENKPIATNSQVHVATAAEAGVKPAEGRFQDVLAAKAVDSASASSHGILSASDKSSVKPLEAPLAQMAPAANQQMHLGQATSVAQNKPVFHMQTGWGSQGWSQELGNKVVWMAGNQGHISELVINPPSMGTVEVRLHVNGTEAGAQFFSANPDVRSAIEAAMPKLREMMANAGITLGEAMVSNQSFSQREAFQQQGQKSYKGNNGGLTAAGITGLVGGTGGVPNLSSTQGSTTSMLDYYA